MRRRLVLPALLIPVLAACGGSGPTAASGTDVPATPGPAATTSGGGGGGGAKPGTTLTACQLVAPADVETALALDAGTVSEGELKEAGTVLDPAVTECRYSGDDWGGLVVSVTPTDGVNVYDALVKSFGEDAETLQVGDGALWFGDNDRGYFLKGPVLVRLQFTHLAETPAGGTFRDPTIALGTAAIAKV